jgi:hypothetical protein
VGVYWDWVLLIFFHTVSYLGELSCVPIKNNHIFQQIDYPFDQLISQTATKHENTTALAALCDCLYVVESQRHRQLAVSEWSLVKVCVFVGVGEIMFNLL